MGGVYIADVADADQGQWHVVTLVLFKSLIKAQFLWPQLFDFRHYLSKKSVNSFLMVDNLPKQHLQQTMGYQLLKSRQIKFLYSDQIWKADESPCVSRNSELIEPLKKTSEEVFFSKTVIHNEALSV